MYNRKQRRLLHAWMSKRHDLSSSWSMYAHDAPHNSGLLPGYEVLGPVAKTFLRVVTAALKKYPHLGNPDTLCAVLADVGARIATHITGDQYRVQSGRWTRVTGMSATSNIQWVERTGSEQDFHAWCVAAHPNHRLVMFDPQSMFWPDDNRLVWDWSDNIDLIGWRAHTATTQKVIALATEFSPIADYLYAATMEELLTRDLITPHHALDGLTDRQPTHATHAP